MYGFLSTNSLEEFSIYMKAFLLIFLILLSISNLRVEGILIDDSKSKLTDAFITVSKAETAGAKVDELVSRLNLAASLIDEGGDSNLKNAESIIAEVTDVALDLEVSSIQNTQNQYYITGFVLIILVAAGLLVWFYGSHWFWVIWLRTKRGWRVER
jgi:hypothetical protein